MAWEIYTDGACLGNPGPGGWAFVVFDQGKEKYAHAEGAADTTNNRMELYAAIMACEYALLAQTYKPHSSRTTSQLATDRPLIVTDSRYVQQGITLWCPTWKKNNWRGSKGEIKNLDLWKRLDAICLTQHVKWAWVKGHQGNAGNERADALATQEAKKTKAGLKSSLLHSSTARLYLQVPFAEKDEAKAQGAKWDAAQKKWYVTSSSDCQKWQSIK